jgi:hypothetical protein
MIRKFVFTDLDDDEKDAIVELVKSEGIRYSIKREFIEIPCEECEDEECFDVFPIFHVEVLTTMEKYDFLKVLLKKKMEKLNWLNKCYALEYGKEKKKKKVSKKAK